MKYSHYDDSNPVLKKWAKTSDRFPFLSAIGFIGAAPVTMIIWASLFLLNRLTSDGIFQKTRKITHREWNRSVEIS